MKTFINFCILFSAFYVTCCISFANPAGGSGETFKKYYAHYELTDNEYKKTIGHAYQVYTNFIELGKSINRPCPDIKDVISGNSVAVSRLYKGKVPDWILNEVLSLSSSTQDVTRAYSNYILGDYFASHAEPYKAIDHYYSSLKSFPDYRKAYKYSNIIVDRIKMFGRCVTYSGKIQGKYDCPAGCSIDIVYENNLPVFPGYITTMTNGYYTIENLRPGEYTLLLADKNRNVSKVAKNIPVAGDINLYSPPKATPLSPRDYYTFDITRTNQITLNWSLWKGNNSMSNFNTKLLLSLPFINAGGLGASTNVNNNSFSLNSKLVRTWLKTNEYCQFTNPCTSSWSIAIYSNGTFITGSRPNNLLIKY